MWLEYSLLFRDKPISANNYFSVWTHFTQLTAQFKEKNISQMFVSNYITTGQELKKNYATL